MSKHLGFIYQSAGRWRKQTALKAFEFEEVVSVAYLEADRLLREKYDPAKATVTTFLGSYLYGRVEYELLRSTGRRKRADGWKLPIQLDRAKPPLEVDARNAVDIEDLIQSLPKNLQDTARRLSQGGDLFECVTGFDSASFDPEKEGWVFEVFVDEVREQFQQAMKSWVE